MKDWITQLRKGLLEYCVLTILSGGESYGYELAQRLRAIEELAVTESTVYPILARLREEAYVTVRAEPSSDGPPRRYFALTQLGRQRLQSMHGYWDRLDIIIRGLRDDGHTGGHEDGDAA